MKASRMFSGLKTWNPYFGCNYHCYRDGCWARKKMAHRLGKMLKCNLCYDFKPHLHPKRLEHVPRDPKIFVGAHCDQFGDWVLSGTIHMILEVCRQTPKELWFFETKNPRRYLEFLDYFPENTVLSTTIETNRKLVGMGRAPPTQERFESIYRVASRFPVHVAIEPIMKFDLDIMVKWMKVLRPIKVAVGYDSLHNCLEEPSKAETLKLIEKLEQFTDVERKQL